jgi:hypothetical protein
VPSADGPPGEPVGVERQGVHGKQVADACASTLTCKDFLLPGTRISRTSRANFTAKRLEKGCLDAFFPLIN